jgi:hypothetical protein
LVVASVAVIGSTEYGRNAVVVFQLVALVHQLMGPGDHLELVRVVELLSDVLKISK